MPESRARHTSGGDTVVVLGRSTPPAWFRSDVDGLRAVAVLLVVCFHAGLPGFGGGFIGVDVFFVISGFVIAALLVREHSESGRIRWRHFYLRRVRRLLPAALLMIVVVLLTSAVLLPPANRATVALAAVAALTSTANAYYWWTARDGAAPTYFDQPADVLPLLHTWSLAVEEQFYLALPVAVVLVLWLARRARWRRRDTAIALVVVGSLSSVAISWWLTGTDQSAGFYLPMGRAFEFGIGALLAIVGWAPRTIAIRLVLGLAGAGLLAYALLWPTPQADFPGVEVVLPCLGAALVIASRPALLALAPMTLLGRLSYSWYLWHVPFLALGEAWNLAPVGDTWSVVLLLLSLGVAAASHRWVETPWRSPGQRHLKVQRPLLAGLAVTFALACTGAASTASQVPPSPYADFETAPDACRLYPSLPVPTSGQRCELTPFDPTRPTVVLRGDSHAWQLAPALLEAQREHPDVNLVAWVLPSCPPMDLSDETGFAFHTALPGSELAATAGAWGQCLVHNYYARRDVARLRQRGGVAVVAAARWAAHVHERVINLREQAALRREPRPIYDELVRDVVSAGVTGMIETHDPLTLVDPVPEPRRHVPRCLAIPAWPGRCDVPRADEEAYLAGPRAWLDDLVGQRSDIRRIDLVDALCDEDACPAESDGIVNYIDDSHLSRSRARLLAPAFEDVFARLAQ